MPNNNNDLIGKKSKAVPVQQKEIGIDTTQNLIHDVLDAAEVSKLDMTSLDGFSNVAQTREETYTLIDTMSQDATISAILETYAEDSVEANEAGQIIWCESSDEHVAKYVSYLLDSLNVDKNAYCWVYNLIKYGDLYLKLYRESDYGDDLLFGNDDNKDVKERLNEDVKVHLNGKNDGFVHYVEAVSNPGEMFELTKFGKTMGYIKAPVRVQQNFDKNSILNQYLTYKMKKNDVNVFDATSFVHACLQDNSSRTPEEVNIFLTDSDMEEDKESAKYTVKRGQSLLYNSFRVWRELTLLENSVLLNRLTKSAIVRVLNVDVGDMPKEQVNNFMSRLKDKIEQKSSLNAGDRMTEYTNPGPIENIIYVPTHGTQGNITAQAIGGDVDVKSLIDLDYFQNLLFGSLKVPKQFFCQTDDSTGFNGGSSLSIISSRYGKAIKRIQNTMCQAITDLINLFLLDKGLTSYVNKFTIRMQPPITQEEIDRRENMRNRIGVINDIMNQVGNVVEDPILKLKVVKTLLADSVTDPEVISLLQEQIDMLEEQEKNGETNTSGNEDMNKPSPINEPSDLGIGLDNNEPPMEDNGEYSNDELNNTNELEGQPEETIEPIDNGDSYLPSPDELQVDMTNNGEF